jgi:hypothetical protein
MLLQDKRHIPAAPQRFSGALSNQFNLPAGQRVKVNQPVAERGPCADGLTHIIKENMISP